MWQGNSCISKFPHVRFEVLDGGDVEALKAPRISFIRSARSPDPSRARGARSRGPDPGEPLSPDVVNGLPVWIPLWVGMYRLLNPVWIACAMHCCASALMLNAAMHHAPCTVMQGSPSPLSQPQQITRAHAPLAIAARQAQPIPR